MSVVRITTDRPFLLLLAAWLVVNLIQASFTPLDPDEAYYWMYAQRLDWGYFDHPPMVALFMAMGQWLPGELGVRFGTVLLSTLTWAGVYLLAGRPQGRQLTTFFLLMAAMPMMEVYGFIATPDAPLLLGAVLFWLAYRHFLNKPGFLSALWWGAAMAFLLYSKYHGILLIGFTVLSNFKLWRMPAFYLAGVLGAALFLPHLYWQWANDFPSFRYHLSGRDDAYQLKHTFNYLLNQLLIFNPLLLWWIVKNLWEKRSEDALERSFRWVTFGFWLFFLWSTSKGHAEPQWTAILTIPFVLLLLKNWRTSQPVWAKRLLWVSLGLFVAIRLLLLWPGEPLLRQFNHEGWVAAIAAESGDTPVLIQNSYRDASLFRFYTGQWAWTMTDVDYRPSQYDLWPDARELHGQTAFLVGQKGWTCKDCARTEGSGRKFKFKRIDNFQVVQQHRFVVQNWPEQLRVGDTLSLELEIANPYDHDIRPVDGQLPLTIALIAEPALERHLEFNALDSIPKLIPARDTILLRQRFLLSDELPSGEYPFVIGWRYKGFPPMRQSIPYRAQVLD